MLEKTRFNPQPNEDITQWLFDPKEARAEKQAIMQAMIDTNYFNQYRSQKHE